MTRFKKEYTAPVFIAQDIYIKPNYIVSIPQYSKENKGLSLEFIKNQDNLLNNETNGKLSRKAVQGLKNAINWLCISAKQKNVFRKKTQKVVKANGQNETVNVAEKWFKFKVNFVTLTLPDTEKPILSKDLQKNLLNPFLTYMRKYHGLKNYVWRLEFQANGKLHVHLTTDSFLHLKIIKDSWNRLLNDNGYLDLFYRKNGHLDPNSTDVHATKNIKNIAAYLAKYMSKKNSVYKLPKKNKPVKALTVMQYKRWYKQRLNFWNSPFNPRPITGRIWSCSEQLSKANKCHVEIPANECSEELRCLMNKEIEYKDIMGLAPKTINAQFNPDDWRNQPKKIGEVYFLKAIDWFTKINGIVKKTFDQTRQAIADLNPVVNYQLELG